MYLFDDDVDLRKLAAFIKDILSFCNTVRTETSYILIGVGEDEKGNKDFCGLQSTYDDSFFQDKVKDKVHPRPDFTYYEVDLQAKRIGIFAFPIKRYTTPIRPTIKMKGIEVGRIYYRQGTCNTEAIAMEVVRIHEWLQSLPSIPDHPNLHNEINNCLSALTKKSEKLSCCIVLNAEIDKAIST
jgi:hypothetical protein